MHTGSYGLMSADGSAQAAGPGGQEGHTATWPVWSGPVPPLAEGFAVRPDTVPGLESALVPGATVALGARTVEDGLAALLEVVQLRVRIRERGRTRQDRIGEQLNAGR